MRYYLICIGFLHVLLLAASLAIIVMGSLLIEDRERDYLIYKMMYCDELMIIFVCAGVFNLLVFIVSAISSALTFPSKEIRELYRLVALVTIVAIIFDLAFIIYGARCKQSPRAFNNQMSKMFRNYGKYQELYTTPEDEGSTSHCSVTSSPGKRFALSNETVFFDYIQFNYECCGVWGKDDYAKINVSIPITCCAVGERINETDQDHLRTGSCTGRHKNRASLRVDEDEVSMDEGPDLVKTSTTTSAPDEDLRNTTLPNHVPHGNNSMILVEKDLDCGGCANVLYRAFSRRALLFWILVFIKIVLDVYVATSSCFILMAEAPPGKYPT